MLCPDGPRGHVRPRALMETAWAHPPAAVVVPSRGGAAPMAAAIVAGLLIAGVRPLWRTRSPPARAGIRGRTCRPRSLARSQIPFRSQRQPRQPRARQCRWHHDRVRRTRWIVATLALMLAMVIVSYRRVLPARSPRFSPWSAPGRCGRPGRFGGAAPLQPWLAGAGGIALLALALNTGAALPIYWSLVFGSAVGSTA